MTETLARHIAGHLRSESVRLTKHWVDILERRLGVEPKRVLPSESLVNHIPKVLDAVADFVEDPREEVVDSTVRADLARLADLRREQGFDVGEVLDEFGILSELIEQSITQAVADFEADCARPEIVRTVGRLKDAIFLLGTETASRYRLWSDRRRFERMRIIESYTAMLSHELGNRLGAAETAVRLILEEGSALPETRLRSLHELILKSLKSGRETVRGVRALFGSGDDDEDVVHALPLATVVRDAVHEMQVAAAERGIDLRLENDGPEEPIDAERLPLALFNLVTNAIRHHDRPDGKGNVVVEVTEQPDTLTITVEDDGPGVPPDLADHVFEPHVRDGGSGAGLGLAIAREAVEQMGGRIWFEPASGRGTRFCFTVRRLRADQSADDLPATSADPDAL